MRSFKPGDVVSDKEGHKRYTLVGPKTLRDSVTGEETPGWIGVQSGGALSGLPRKIPTSILRTFRLVGNCLD